MAQGGDEQAATRALAEAAQDRQGWMFDTHQHWLNVALKQNEELMHSIAAEQDLALKLAEQLGPCPAPEPRPVQPAQGAMVGRTQHRKCATPGGHEMQLPLPGSPLRSQCDGALRCCGVRCGLTCRPTLQAVLSRGFGVTTLSPSAVPATIEVAPKTTVPSPAVLVPCLY
jgi:hypothetical protein